MLLGHIVCEDGFLVDLRKINIIMDMPTPTNVTELNLQLHVSHVIEF